MKRISKDYLKSYAIKKSNNINNLKNNDAFKPIPELHTIKKCDAKCDAKTHAPTPFLWLRNNVFYCRMELPLVVFAELKSTWHYHILLNSSSFTQKELENALIVSGMSDYEIDISPIQNKYATGIYCTKQLHLDIYSMMIMDTSRIMTSYDLFNIPFKEKKDFILTYLNFLAKNILEEINL